MSTTTNTVPDVTGAAGEPGQGAVNSPKHVESALPTSASMPPRLPEAPAGKGSQCGRLVRVELRKLSDTQAGRGLLYAIVGVVGVVVAALFFSGGAQDHSFADYLQATIMPVAILLPVVGILAVTAEWSQRTGLVTFALEPRRNRVTWAKVVASLLVGVFALVAAIALAALAHEAAILFRGAEGNWQVDALPLIGGAAFVLLGMLQGLGFAMLFKNTPAAIVTYFALPTAWSILGELFSWMETPAKWLDMGRAMQPLFNGSLTGEQWAQLGTSVALWVAVPFIVGMWMLRRSEVK